MRFLSSYFENNDGTGWCEWQTSERQDSNSPNRTSKCDNVARIARTWSHRRGATAIRIGRRNLIAGLGAVLTAPSLVRAQQAERMRRIGVLVPGTEEDSQLRDRIKSFEQGLEKLGWIDGRNLRIEYRWHRSAAITQRSSRTRQRES
jgi:hypothetical protein